MMDPQRKLVCCSRHAIGCRFISAAAYAKYNGISVGGIYTVLCHISICSTAAPKHRFHSDRKGDSELNFSSCCTDTIDGILSSDETHVSECKLCFVAHLFEMRT